MKRKNKQRQKIQSDLTKAVDDGQGSQSSAYTSASWKKYNDAVRRP